ncbi:MAG: hypothetical protein V1873_08175 [Verrucomicrobiota bacterium]
MKVVWGLVLLPFCYAATRTLVFLVHSIQPLSYSSLPLSAWGLLIGFCLWVVLYLCLPRPMRTYVLAHELTHALWGWVMGARVSKLRVGKSGGSVSLSKDNFLITLAPYFFPLYTVLAIIGYNLVSVFVDLHTYEPFCLGLVGLTWGFHLTFTISTLLTHQPDIRACGRLFSYSFIYLMNVLGIALWIVMVASPRLETLVARLGDDIIFAWTACWHVAVRAGAAAADFSKHWKK